MEEALGDQHGMLQTMCASTPRCIAPLHLLSPVPLTHVAYLSYHVHHGSKQHVETFPFPLHNVPPFQTLAHFGTSALAHIYKSFSLAVLQLLNIEVN